MTELTPQAIREVEFREKLRGYHPDDVDAFVERVAATVEQLQQRLTAPEPGTPGVSEDTLHRTLLIAQRTADQVVEEAHQQAQQLVAEARSEADARRAEADRDLQRERRDRTARLHDEIERLADARSRLQQDVTALQEYIDTLRSRLREALLEQLHLLEDATTEASPPVMSEVPIATAGVAQEAVEEEHDAGQAASEMVGEEPADEDPVDVASAERAEPAEDIDVFARGRNVKGRLPGEGEDDPFLAELRRAVASDDDDEEVDESRVMSRSGGGRLFRRR